MTELLEHGVVEGKILPRPIERDPDDPPIFLLQASSTWAPWLQDGQYQRVLIGSAGQVLTVNADGSVGWSNASSGFTNPMTQTGDLISSNPGSTPVAIHIGTSGQVLMVVSGSPAWATAPWMTNPMTTAQDLIVGGSAGSPGRLGVGSNGQVLTVNGGAVSWQNATSGFTNPMTTLGDIISGGSGGSAQRLGIGAAGQVLTVSSGAPAWVNPVTGFANPMTQAGDMITGLIAGAATRLPVGSNGQVLTVVSGAPAWQSGSAGPSAVVFPSGDTSGVTDQANITATWTSGSLTHGGEVILANGAFYVKPTSGLQCLTVPAQTSTYPGTTVQGNPVCMRGCGPATIIFPVGAGVIGVWYHRTTSYGGQFGNPADPAVGYQRDYVIDGTFTSGAAIGLDLGDGRGFDVDISVQNFDTTGAIGFNLSKQLFWTEKNCTFRCQSYNNSTAVVIGNPLALTDVSQEYCQYDINMFCNSNQQGVVVSGGINMGGSELKIRGNMALTSSSTAGAPTNNVAMLSFIGSGSQGGSRMYFGRIWTKVEGNPGNGTGTVYPFGVYSDGTGYVRQSSGLISHSLSNSQLNGAEFNFDGAIFGDNALVSQASGVLTNNPLGPGQGSLTISGNVSGAGQVLSVTNIGTSPTNPPMLYTGAQSGDHAFGIQVSGDSNPRWKVDVGGDTLWGSGSAVQDVDLGRNAAGVLLIGGGTANTANVRLGIGGSAKSVLSLAESSSAPSTVTGAGVLYVSSTGALHYLSPAGTDTQIGPP